MSNNKTVWLLCCGCLKKDESKTCNNILNAGKYDLTDSLNWFMQFSLVVLF